MASVVEIFTKIEIVMQNFTYHTHNNELHFDGHHSAEEMIAAAEAKGFAEIGVSNHLICHKNLSNMPNYEPMFFCDFKTAEAACQRHIEIIRAAAEKHKIKVRIGFEVDFFPSAYWRNNFEKMRKNLDVDYLIGSTHFLYADNESFLCNLYHIKHYPDLPSRPEFQEYLRNYWRNIAAAVESGYFTFMAHLDYCAIFNLCTTPEWDNSKNMVIEALAKYRQPYELNTSGYNRINRPHPEKQMLIELNKHNVPVLLSDDSHDVATLGQHFKRAEKLLSDIGYINRFNPFKV